MDFNGTIDINAIIVILGLFFALYKWVRQHKIDQKKFISQLSATHALPLHQAAGGIAAVFANEIEEHLGFYQGQIDGIDNALNSETGEIGSGLLEPPTKMKIYEHYFQKIDAMGFDAISFLVHYYSNLDELDRILGKIRADMDKQASADNVIGARDVFVKFQKVALRAYVELIYEMLKSEKSVLYMTEYSDKEEQLELADKGFLEKLALMKLRYNHVPVADVIEQSLGQAMREKFENMSVQKAAC